MNGTGPSNDPAPVDQPHPVAGAGLVGTALELPARARKPRRRGLSMVIDGGLPLGQFRDVVASAAEHIDVVKFGWGTAVVTPTLAGKIEALREAGVGYYFGGTLFEKHVLQGRFDDFRRFCDAYSCRYVEVSNGTIDLPNSEKAGYIRKLTSEYTVVSEVGYKESDRSQQLAPSEWVRYIREDLDAGADLVTLEARESGRSGICRPDGELRFGLIEDVLAAGIEADRLLFEAPSTALQAYFVKRIGTDVNLGNIPPAAVIGLETLRLGLRADTLTTFE